MACLERMDMALQSLDSGNQPDGPSIYAKGRISCVLPGDNDKEYENHINYAIQNQNWQCGRLLG